MNPNLTNPFQDTSKIQRTPTNLTQTNSQTRSNLNQLTGISNPLYTSTPSRASIYRESIDLREQYHSEIEDDKTPLVETQINQNQDENLYAGIDGIISAICVPYKVNVKSNIWCSVNNDLMVLK